MNRRQLLLGSTAVAASAAVPFAGASAVMGVDLAAGPDMTTIVAVARRATDQAFTDLIVYGRTAHRIMPDKQGNVIIERIEPADWDVPPELPYG